MGERGARHRRLRSVGAIALSLLAVASCGTETALAAEAPTVVEAWSAAVFSSSARLQARINPNGASTVYHADYITLASYEANLAAAKEPFAGASRSPTSTEIGIGAGTSPVGVTQFLSSLTSATTYRYRIVAKNSFGTVFSSTLSFATQAVGAGGLPDGRGWEMVSPADKNGGQVEAPEGIAGGGVLQAGAAGGAVTYGSTTSFGSGAGGAAPGSQYIATRTGSGWVTVNITAPLYSGSYGTETEGVPYQLFSGDLARGLLLNGRHCRGEGSDCAVPNPPLPGTDAPAGYQNYYLREESGYTALLGAANAGFLRLEPAEFELRLAGTSADLRHPVLSTCAALTANATEVTLGSGCDPAKPNLYEYSPGSGLALVNLLPGDGAGTPGAVLAAQSTSVSSSGSRVYFTVGGNLYLREGSATKQVDAALSGGGNFQTASADGAVAFYLKGGHLYRYEAAGAGASTDLTPGGGVAGVLGAAEDGSSVFYLTGGGLFRWHGGTSGPVAAAADASNYPPTTGRARVSADGTKLLFVSTASLTGYDNKDLNTGLPDSEVFLYNATGGSLVCISCNPTFERPIGSSTLPGAIANGSAPGSTDSYKPRVLAANNRRVFFESSDAIEGIDTDNSPDVYQWEAQGEGSCSSAPGCIALLSGGKAAGGTAFADASTDGSDAFFVTSGSLLPTDPGAVDMYDARVGGGFPSSPPEIICTGDACQPLEPAPVDPTLTTLLTGPGNPAVRYPDTGKKCKKGKVKRKGRCVKKKKRKKQRHGKHSGKRGRR